MAKIMILLMTLGIVATMANHIHTTVPTTVAEPVTMATADNSTGVTMATSGVTTAEGAGGCIDTSRRRQWRTMSGNSSDSDELEAPGVQEVGVLLVSGTDKEEESNGCRWRKRKYRRRNKQVGGDDEDGKCGRGRRRKWKKRGEVTGEQDGGILVLENSDGDLLLVVEETTTVGSRKRSRCRGSRRRGGRRRKNRRRWRGRKTTTPSTLSLSEEEYEDVGETVDDGDEVEVEDADVEDADVEMVEDNEVNAVSIHAV